jgi:hypothetical protein
MELLVLIDLRCVECKDGNVETFLLKHLIKFIN